MEAGDFKEMGMRELMQYEVGRGTLTTEDRGQEDGGSGRVTYHNYVRKMPLGNLFF